MDHIVTAPKRLKWQLRCGIAGSLLFVLMFLAEGFLRDNYLPMRHPVSSLAIGPRGWVQVLNFLISGTGILISAFALHRILGATYKTVFRLVALIGIGLIGAGICITDPVYGYPLDQPLKLAQFTTQGHLHDAFSLLVFICLPWACFVMRRYFKSRGDTKWAFYSFVTAWLVIVTFVLSGVGFKQVPGLVQMAGLLQRSSITVGCAWVASLSLYFLRTQQGK